MYHLGAQARRNPDAIAVIESGGRTVTYGELDARSRHIAQALGARPGDSIAILMPDGAAFLEVAWAAQRSGLSSTPVNEHLRPAEVDAMVGGRLLVTEEVYGRLLATPVSGELHEREGRELMFSGGTTGTPKPVRKELTAGPMGDPEAECVKVALGLTRFGMGPDTVYLSPAPFYHAAPLVYCMSLLRLGATLVVMDRFDPAECLELIERHRVTHAQFVSTMFVRMLKLPPERRDRDLSGLKLVLQRRALPGGGEAADAPLVRPDHLRVLLGHRGLRVRVHRAGGVAGAPRVGGQGGPGRPDRRRRRPLRRAQPRRRRPHRRGRLPPPHDRISHMIVSGGGDIYPQEAENVLVMHPNVADAAVIGAPDPEMGEKVLAVVVPEGEVTAEELIAYCRERLAHDECPREVDFVTGLPRDPSGKLRKGLLKESYWRDHETKIV